MAIHHLDDTQPHAFWDNTLPPRIYIQPGDTVVFETLEASAGQVTPGCSSEVLRTLSFDPIHPLTGPVYVEGAEPGDALIVDIVSIKHKGWGWNAVIPGFGLLAEDFPEPYVQHYKLGEDCEFREDIHIPYEPFCGVMGVGPREPGRFITIPPRENAGNIDIRHLTPGSHVFFPSWSPAHCSPVVTAIRPKVTAKSMAQASKHRACELSLAQAGTLTPTTIHRPWKKEA